MTLAAPGATTSLGANKALVVDGVVPEVPTGLVVTDGNTSTNLAWSAGSENDLASFKVYGDTTTTPVELLLTIPSSVQFYSHTGLSNWTTYYYRISSMDNAGNESEKTSVVNARPRPQKYTVKTDSTGDYLAIQSAIEITADADTVLVYPGTYTENITIDEQYVIVTSMSGADSTIINGNSSGSCAIIRGSSVVTFSGFSIRSGLASNGGAIYIEGSGTILLENLYVYSNLASNDGGGIYIAADDNSSITINRSKIYQNECVNKGGGINNQNDNVVIKNTLIYNNATQQDGGGLHSVSYTHLRAHET